MKIGEGPRAMTLEVVCEDDDCRDVMELRSGGGEIVLSLGVTEDPEAELKEFGAALAKVWRAGFSAGWVRRQGLAAERVSPCP